MLLLLLRRDIALAQVTELWTQFGNLTEIWLVRAACEHSAAFACTRRCALSVMAFHSKLRIRPSRLGILR